MSSPTSQDEQLERQLQRAREQEEQDVQDVWRNWDPQTPMPDIIAAQTRGHSGWDLEFEAQIARNMANMSPWPQEPRVAQRTNRATPGQTVLSTTNGTTSEPGGDDSDDSYGAIPQDDDFMDPLEDRSYLEFVLLQRDCVARRAAHDLPPTSCTRSAPCVDCRQHEGFSVPITYWQFIADDALEEHVGNYLRIRPSLPVWQPIRPSNLHPPQLFFGGPRSPAGEGEAVPSAGPPAPLPFEDGLEDLRTD